MSARSSGSLAHAQPLPDETGGADEERFHDAFFFGDSEAPANELAHLALRGVKRATAGLVGSDEEGGRPVPQSGDLSIVTDWSGQPFPQTLRRLPLLLIDTRSAFMPHAPSAHPDAEVRTTLVHNAATATEPA